MSRIELITTAEGLDPATGEVYDWIVASRGKMVRPFEVLLHAPELARKVAELGHVVRYESSLPDELRELAILTVGSTLDCGFVWDSHLGLAKDAGLGPEAIAAARGENAQVAEGQQAIIGFVTALCRDAAVPDDAYDAVREYLGDVATVELAATVGYYAMLGMVMSATESC